MGRLVACIFFGKIVQFFFFAVNSRYFFFCLNVSTNKLSRCVIFSHKREYGFTRNYHKKIRQHDDSFVTRLYCKKKHYTYYNTHNRTARKGTGGPPGRLPSHLGVSLLRAVYVEAREGKAVASAPRDQGHPSVDSGMLGSSDSQWVHVHAQMPSVCFWCVVVTCPKPSAANSP